MTGHLYGWWSDKQALELQRQGMHWQWYLTPDRKRVAVTCVTPTDQHNTGWDDIRYVGKVTRIVMEDDL